jgi:hypothetical protein
VKTAGAQAFGAANVFTGNGVFLSHPPGGGVANGIAAGEAHCRETKTRPRACIFRAGDVNGGG